MVAVVALACRAKLDIHQMFFGYMVGGFRVLGCPEVPLLLQRQHLDVRIGRNQSEAVLVFSQSDLGDVGTGWLVCMHCLLSSVHCLK